MLFTKYLINENTFVESAENFGIGLIWNPQLGVKRLMLYLSNVPVKAPSITYIVQATFWRQIQVQK